MGVKKGQRLRVTATPRQKEVARMIFNRDVRPDPKLKKMTDKEICVVAGYSPKKPSTDVIRAKGVQVELKEYYKYPDLVEGRLKAKMLRNIDDGLDSFSPDDKLNYTKLQVKREDTKVKAESKVVINANTLNMMGMLGIDQET